MIRWSRHAYRLGGISLVGLEIKGHHSSNKYDVTVKLGDVPIIIIIHDCVGLCAISLAVSRTGSKI